MNMMKIKCWWYGCQPDYKNATKYNDGDGVIIELSCKRCGTLNISYEDFSGNSRKRKFEAALIYLVFRKWFPRKCHDCKKRYGKHKGCLPF